ncbi:hypothetical protein OXX69_005258 [Metschnikowia pulcherrima]
MSMDEDLFNDAENDDMLEDRDDHDEDNDHSDMDIDMEHNRDGNNDHEENAGEDNNENGNDDDEEEDDDDEEDDEGDDDEEGEENEDVEEREQDEQNDTRRAEFEPRKTANGNGNGEENNTKLNSASQDKVTDENGATDSKNGSDRANGDTNRDTDKNSKDSSQTKAAAVIDSYEIRSKALEAVKKASEFDIVPVVAIPYAPQCHSIALSEGPKWILTGGEDGFIRKYDFAASIDGKAPLTVAQKHNLMDNITKAGVIGGYWENEQPMTRSQIINENPKIRDSDFTTGIASYEPKVNPVYSLDVEKNGLWCLSGLLSGGISLYTMIYNEGAIHHYFPHNGKKNSEPTLDTGHSDAVSVLRLNYAQTSFLSGSWDKTIREWDLNTGKAKSLFKGNTGQISSIQYRPVGLADLTFDESNSDVDSLFGSDEEDENGDNGANVSRSSMKSETSNNKTVTEDKIFMSSSIDGAINIWDVRVSGSSPVLRLGVPEGTPPWCMTASWSNDGDKIYAGRRNSTVEEFSLRMPHEKKAGNISVPNVSKRLAFPKISGPVSSLSVMPNDNFLFCGSNDNIRLYNLNLYDEFTQETATAKKRATPFYVIPGHHGGILSNLIVDETGRFMISTSGNRGWGHSSYADVVLVYSIDTEAPQQ